MTDQPASPDNILELTNLTKRFGGLVAVDSVSLQIRRGEVFALIGPNGAGKTTLFNSVTGLFQPTSGSVVFDGKEITGSKPHQVARSGIARTFQNIRLFPHLTVMETVMIGEHCRAYPSVWGALADAVLRRPFKQSTAERGMHDSAIGLLEFLGLANKRDDKATDLSYGEQRRLELARALARSEERRVGKECH